MLSVDACLVGMEGAGGWRLLNNVDAAGLLPRSRTLASAVAAAAGVLFVNVVADPATGRVTAGFEPPLTLPSRAGRGAFGVEIVLDVDVAVATGVTTGRGDAVRRATAAFGVAGNPGNLPADVLVGGPVGLGEAGRADSPDNSRLGVAAPPLVTREAPIELVSEAAANDTAALRVPELDGVRGEGRGEAEPGRLAGIRVA
jgi:hypothetical protein